MGINGLLPVLKPISRAVHLSNYKGQCVAVDAYSWLHKAVYSCSLELCLGRFTKAHVQYCLSRVRQLRQYGVEPVLVFDGGRLPSKADEESQRQRSRKEAYEKGLALMQQGNKRAAESEFTKAVDVNPSMAKMVIEEMKTHNVKCLVAPYEADAQMAYLAINGHVHAIITEDSDLLTYGCPRVLFKLDRDGSAQEMQLSELSANTGTSFKSFNHTMFQEMCVMAGCDFLPNIPGIGIKKAHGLITKFKSFTKACKSLRFEGQFTVPSEYEEGFQRALWVFRHQRVYCEATGKLVHVNPLPPGGLGASNVDVPKAVQYIPDSQGGALVEDLNFLGPLLDPDIARGIAIGDLDPMTYQPFDLEAIYRDCPNQELPPSVAIALGRMAPVGGPQSGGVGGLSGGSGSGAAGFGNGAGSGGSGVSQRGYTTLHDLAQPGRSSGGGGGLGGAGRGGGAPVQQGVRQYGARSRRGPGVQASAGDAAGGGDGAGAGGSGAAAAAAGGDWGVVGQGRKGSGSSDAAGSSAGVSVGGSGHVQAHDGVVGLGSGGDVHIRNTTTSNDAGGVGWQQPHSSRATHTHRGTMQTHSGRGGGGGGGTWMSAQPRTSGHVAKAVPAKNSIPHLFAAAHERSRRALTAPFIAPGRSSGAGSTPRAVATHATAATAPASKLSTDSEPVEVVDCTEDDGEGVVCEEIRKPIVKETNPRSPGALKSLQRPTKLLRGHLGAIAPPSESPLRDTTNQQPSTTTSAFKMFACALPGRRMSAPAKLVAPRQYGMGRGTLDAYFGQLSKENTLPLDNNLGHAQGDRDNLGSPVRGASAHSQQVDGMDEVMASPDKGRQQDKGQQHKQVSETVLLGERAQPRPLLAALEPRLNGAAAGLSQASSLPSLDSTLDTLMTGSPAHTHIDDGMERTAVDTRQAAHGGEQPVTNQYRHAQATQQQETQQLQQQVEGLRRAIEGSPEPLLQKPLVSMSARAATVERCGDGNGQQGPHACEKDAWTPLGHMRLLYDLSPSGGEGNSTRDVLDNPAQGRHTPGQKRHTSHPQLLVSLDSEEQQQQALQEQLLASVGADGTQMGVGGSDRGAWLKRQLHLKEVNDEGDVLRRPGETMRVSGVLPGGTMSVSGVLPGGVMGVRDRVKVDEGWVGVGTGVPRLVLGQTTTSGKVTPAALLFGEFAMRPGGLRDAVGGLGSLRGGQVEGMSVSEQLELSVSGNGGVDVLQDVSRGGDVDGGKGCMGQELHAGADVHGGVHGELQSPMQEHAGDGVDGVEEQGLLQDDREGDEGRGSGGFHSLRHVRRYMGLAARALDEVQQQCEQEQQHQHQQHLQLQEDAAHGPVLQQQQQKGRWHEGLVAGGVQSAVGDDDDEGPVLLPVVSRLLGTPGKNVGPQARLLSAFACGTHVGDIGGGAVHRLSPSLVVVGPRPVVSPMKGIPSQAGSDRGGGLFSRRVVAGTGGLRGGLRPAGPQRVGGGVAGAAAAGVKAGGGGPLVSPVKGPAGVGGVTTGALGQGLGRFAYRAGGRPSL